MTDTPPIPTRTRRFGPAIAMATSLVFIVLALVLYGVSRPPGKALAFAGGCPVSQKAAVAVDPLVNGEVAALILADHDNSLADIAFDGPDGKKTTVGAFKGRTILLNLWATWCVPCRQEMPSLATLQTSLGSDAFAVVAINIDTARLDKPKAFLRDIGATALPFYADNTADILQQLRRNQKIIGLPTTILIGKDGCEIGTMAGPAKWDSPDATALIKGTAG